MDAHTDSAVMAEPLTVQSSDKSFAVTWKEPSEKSLPAPMLLSQPHHVTIKSKVQKVRNKRNENQPGLQAGPEKVQIRSIKSTLKALQLIPQTKA